MTSKVVTSKIQQKNIGNDKSDKTTQKQIINVDDINKNNNLFIKGQISRKQGPDPYYGTLDMKNNVITDMDQFPYQRFFRGEYMSSNPIVFDREAGYRQVNNNCYKLKRNNIKGPYPNHCFQLPCSTEFPCFPQLNERIADKESILLESNRSCIVEYR